MRRTPSSRYVDGLMMGTPAAGRPPVGVNVASSGDGSVVPVRVVVAVVLLVAVLGVAWLSRDTWVGMAKSAIARHATKAAASDIAVVGGVRADTWSLKIRMGGIQADTPMNYVADSISFGSRAMADSCFSTSTRMTSIVLTKDSLMCSTADSAVCALTRR